MSILPYFITILLYGGAMGTKVLNIGKNKLENREYAKDDAFPFRIDYEEITNYAGSAFECHWHPELEFTYILTGAMMYQANNNQYLVKAGDALFVNQNGLHAGTAYHHSSCKYFAITFQPSLISGHKNSIFENKYLTQIINNEQISSVYFDAAEKESSHVVSILLQLEKYYKDKTEGYELLIESKLFELWFYLYQDVYCKLPIKSNKQPKNIIQIKSALDYIHANYKENLSLEDIASSCSLSKSSCCRLFKKILHSTPFDYLLNYRIQKSIPYLLSKGMNITEVALSVGFSSSSYYSEIFKKCMNYSPTAYKKFVKFRSPNVEPL